MTLFLFGATHFLFPRSGGFPDCLIFLAADRVDFMFRIPVQLTVKVSLIM